MKRPSFSWIGCCLCLLLCSTGRDVRAQASAPSTDVGCADAGPCTSSPIATSTRGAAPAPAQIGVFATGGAIVGLEEEAAIVRNQPYQATAVTEIRQTLANGTHINQTIEATVARDSEGRTVRAQKLGAGGPFFALRIGAKADAPWTNGESAMLTTIFDPVAREHIDYTSDMKVAHVIPMDVSPAPAAGGRSRTFSVAGHGEGEGPVVAFAGPAGARGRVVAGGGSSLSIQRAVVGGDPARTEDLGTRPIDGIEATGTRKTWSIPAGAIGNDQDLVTTEETWYSPELQMVLLSVRDDPRFGTTTYSLRNLTRNEPDKRLFEVPAGYAVENVPVPLPDLPGAESSR